MYLSGHGVLDDVGTLYLAVKDTESDLLEWHGRASILRHRTNESLPIPPAGAGT